MAVFVVISVFPIIAVLAVSWSQKSAKTPPALIRSNAPVHVEFVDCKQPDYDSSDWLYGPDACMPALRSYLEMNPAQRILGVTAIASNAATSSLAVFWGTDYGPAARDLFVDELCSHIRGGCLNVLHDDTTSSADVVTWVAINGPKGLQSILRLRARYGAQRYRWDEGRGTFETP